MSRQIIGNILRGSKNSTRNCSLCFTIVLTRRIRKQDEKVGSGEREDDAIRLQPYKEPAHLLAEHARRVGRAIPVGSAELLILRPRVSSRYVDLPVNHATKQPPRPSCSSNSRESRLECTWLPFRNPRLTQSSNNTSDTLYP